MITVRSHPPQLAGRQPASTGPVPATWAGVDSALRAVAPRVWLLVAKVGNGACQPLHSIDPRTAAPLGSAFKLYVLAALGEAVAAGKAFTLAARG